MTSSDAPKTQPTAKEKLAALVAQRKASGGHGPGQGLPGQKTVERAAAARAASKSKPAARKG